MLEIRYDKNYVKEIYIYIYISIYILYIYEYIIHVLKSVLCLLSCLPAGHSNKKTHLQWEFGTPCIGKIPQPHHTEEQ